jgi:hypothetical protein
MARLFALLILSTACSGVLSAPPQLAAASCGVRKTLWMEHYSAVLYLPKRAGAQVELASPAAPKVLEMQIIDPRFLPREIPRKWREPIEKHLDAASAARASAAYRALKKGDRLTLTYAANQGVTFQINDRLIARSPGHGLVQAILATWADDEPLPEKLRRTLARNTCRAEQLASSTGPRR